MDESSSYGRMFDVFAASHRKNKNPVRVLMKLKKGRAVTENGGELHRKRGCGNLEPITKQGCCFIYVV